MFAVVFFAGCATTQESYSALNERTSKEPHNSVKTIPKPRQTDRTQTKNGMFKLKVDAPKGAVVKIMNIKPKYKDDMELKKGKYHIVVTKKGYEKFDRWILLDKDTVYVVKLKKAAAPKLERNYFKYVKQIDWDFANERFSLVYDEKNHLIWGLQSAYVDYVKKNHPKKPLVVLEAYKIGNKYYRRMYFKLDTIVYEGYYRRDRSKYYRFKDNNKLAIYYKAKYGKPSIKKPYGTLANLEVNEQVASWRIPTFKEIRRNNPFKKYQKYFAMHFDSTFYSPNYGELMQRTFGLPVLMTGYYGSTRGGYVWAYRKDHSGLYTRSYLQRINSMGVWEMSLKNNLAFILPVRKISTKYDKVIFNTHYTPQQKLSYLTSMLTQEALSVRKRNIPKPKKIPHVVAKKLKRGEFEKSGDYQKRVAAYRQEIAAKNKAIDKKNAQAMQEYSQKLAAQELRYQKLLKHNSQTQTIAQTASEMANKAMRMIFGDPKFTDVVYDADKEVFSATLYSSSNDLEMRVQIPVSIDKAKKFKTDIMDDKLVPVVRFEVRGNKLHFKSLKIITNEEKIENDLSGAKEKDTPQVYREFLAEYPDYKGKKEVERLLQNAIEKEAYDKANTLGELKAFLKKYPHSKYTQKAKNHIQKIEMEKRRKAEAYAKKRAAYNVRKKVGDAVCKDGTTALVLSITMKAYVERVNGDNIQLRIADTEGTSPYYNGVRLYKGTLIWDRYDNWYKCR